MAFGPTRPPIMKDVAEVIAKDVKEGEGHTPTSETPLAFAVPGTDQPAATGIDTRVRWLLIGGLVAVLALIALLALR